MTMPERLEPLLSLGLRVSGHAATWYLPLLQEEVIP